LSSRIRLLAAQALSTTAARDYDVVLPTPLSKRRQIERGFNQAEIIASWIAGSLHLPVDAVSLARKGHTAIHRVGMDATARRQSVKNAFHVVRPKLISGKAILLVDDVLTSGATASTSAEVLKESGAVRVDVFTLARAVMH
jgi:ComF family protein